MGMSERGSETVGEVKVELLRREQGGSSGRDRSLKQEFPSPAERRQAGKECLASRTGSEPALEETCWLIEEKEACWEGDCWSSVEAGAASGESDGRKWLRPCLP
jgi:hypothetical protein